jgi:CRP-like cAMP-binding protein
LSRPLGDEHPLVRKLESIVELGDDEREALRALPMLVRELRPQQDIVREGDHPTQSCLLLDGLLFRYRLVGADDRQIITFHVPGEVPDLQSLFLKTMDHSLATLTQSRVGFIQHRTLQELIERHPRLNATFWRETLIEAAIFRDVIIGLGCRRAPVRIAHFFCEMFLRLKSVGLVEEDWTVRLPLTQEELGDALGLSAVHTNRSLQDLRSQNLFIFEGGRLTIRDWPALKRIADFDGAYLHLRHGFGAE